MSCYLFVLKLQTYIVIVFVIFNSSINKIVISQIEINNYFLVDAFIDISIPRNWSVWSTW